MPLLHCNDFVALQRLIALQRLYSAEAFIALLLRCNAFIALLLRCNAFLALYCAATPVLHPASQVVAITSYNEWGEGTQATHTHTYTHTHTHARARAPSPPRRLRRGVSQPPAGRRARGAPALPYSAVKRPRGARVPRLLPRGAMQRYGHGKQLRSSLYLFVAPRGARVPCLA